MHRIGLTAYKGMVVTPDTAECLRLLEKQASDNGRWRVRYVPSDVRTPTPMAVGGREVHFKFERDDADPQTALYAAWSCAIPLGLTPKLRYPIVEPGRLAFHCFGPWQHIYDRLIAEGRGHLAWSSVCTAAQVDVGKWPGDKEEARFVQAQLHRVGRNCGPLDGVVGQRTAAAMESLGLPRGSLVQVAEHLRTAEAIKNPGEVGRGHLLIPGHEVVVEASDGVRSWPMPHGAGFEVNGPGRVMVEVR